MRKTSKEERKKLDLPIEIARKIDLVAERKKISFNDACIFLLSKVLAPSKRALKGASTSAAVKPA